MSKVCGTCLHLDPYNSRDCSYFGEKWKEYHCKELGGYHKETESANACRYYKESIATQKKNQQSGCFITTAVVNTLGYDDNRIVLRTLRKFRSDILHPDPQKQNILLEYDVVGPLISNAIKNDPDKTVLSHSLIYNYLIPITKMIREKNNFEAIASYKVMVNQLKNHYGIKLETQNWQYIDEVPQNDTGKGYSVYTKSCNDHCRMLVKTVKEI